MSRRSNADKVAAALLAQGATVALGAVAVTRLHTQQLKAQVQANASGRPGPRVQTGNYRRSWSGRTAISAGRVTGTVGTRAAQARRLEQGFIGTDSRGRVYSQAPLPHLKPAHEQVGRSYVAAMVALVRTDAATGGWTL